MKKHVWFQAILIIVLILTASIIFFALIDSHGVSHFITLYQFSSHQKKQLSLLSREQEIWQSQDVNNYLLKIQVVTSVYNFDPNIYTSPACKVHIKVQDGIANSVTENTCEQNGYIPPESFSGFWWGGFNLFSKTNAPSVDDLFVSIKSAFTEPWCGPNGCECEGYYTYFAEYDKSLGYPRSLKVMYAQPPVKPVFCTLRGASSLLFPDYDISIVQLP
jgi:hypothetical protein